MTRPAAHVRPSGGPLKIAERWNPKAPIAEIAAAWTPRRTRSPDAAGGVPACGASRPKRSAGEVRSEVETESRCLGATYVARARKRLFSFGISVNLIRLLTGKCPQGLEKLSASTYIHASIWRGVAMWKPKAKQRFKAKGVAGSDTYSEQVRGEVGRTGATREAGSGLTDASRRFLASLGESVPVPSGGAHHGRVRRWKDMSDAEKDAIRRDLEKGAKR